MKTGNRLSILIGIVMLSFGLISVKSKADTQYLHILSPKAMDTVNDGELFIAVQLLDTETFYKPSVMMWLDGYIANFQARVTSKKLTMLYLNHLHSGKHHIKINAKTSDGGILEPLEWDFFIRGKSAEMEKKEKEEQEKFSVSGYINAYSRYESITGPGAGLRQEPPKTNEIGFSIEPKYKSVSIPISGFYTSNDNVTVQPRSKFRVGIKTNFMEAYYGDHFPVYDALIVNGIRVHGYEAIAKFRRTTISIVQGDLTRAVDGQLLKARRDTAFIPYNLRKDSFYVTPGVYRRNVIAGRINVGKEEEGSTFGITFLHSQDDINSIKYGGSPKQNAVIGADQSITTQNGVLRETAGWAMSMTTNDYSLGAITKEQLDTNLKTTVPIDPTIFKRFLVINSSTDPLLIQKQTSQAWYLRTQLKLAFNRISVDYRRTGPSFYSFGNPFLRNDIEEISAADNMNFWKRRINLQLKYVTNTNNLYKQLTNTVINNNYVAQLSFSPSPKLPQIYGGVRQNDRITTSFLETFYKVDDKILTYTGGLTYRLVTGGVTSNLNANYSTSVRNSSNLPDNTSKSNIIFASLQEDLGGPVSFSLQYSNYNTFSMYKNDSLVVLQKLNSYGGMLSYSFKKAKIKLSAGYNTNMNLPTGLTSASSRDVYTLQFRMDITRHCNFSIDGGHAIYTDTRTGNNYKEFYGFANLNYMF